jgi:hypothetical protein
MIAEPRCALALFVDRASRQWIVRDKDGNYWAVSATATNAWGRRERFHPTEETELAPVPGHYKAMLGLPN